MRLDRDPNGLPSGSGAHMSVALLVGVALMPIVIAVGFMMEASDIGAVPGDISIAAMRGGLDGTTDHHPPAASRAGF